MWQILLRLPFTNKRQAGSMTYGMKSTQTICFMNNKGGSGKSTSCANLGYELATAGHRTLLIDGDMQLNLSLSFFDEEKVLSLAEGEKNLYEAVRTRQALGSYIVETQYDNLHLIPSSTLMSQIEYDLFPMMQREFVLKKCLEGIKETAGYEYILIDAPPTLGAWAINILCATDKVIVPVEASPWGLFGLANMFDFLEKMQDMTQATVMGILITKVDERKNYYRQTREILDSYEAIHVFDTFIHVDASVEWAQDASMPVRVYKKNTRSALEYAKLAEEVMRDGGR